MSMLLGGLDTSHNMILRSSALERSLHSQPRTSVHRIPLKDQSKRSNSSPRSNITKAIEIRNFVSSLRPLTSDEKEGISQNDLPAKSPSIIEQELSRKYLNSLLNKQEAVSLEKIKRQEKETEQLLKRSKLLDKSKSCERQKVDSESRRDTRISDKDILLFKDVSTPHVAESLGQTQEMIQTSTQNFSNINSKYVKQESNNYTDLSERCA